MSLDNLSTGQKVFGIAAIIVVVWALYVRSKNKAAAAAQPAQIVGGDGTAVVTPSQDSSGILTAIKDAIAQLTKGQADTQSGLTSLIGESGTKTVGAINDLGASFVSGFGSLGTSVQGGFDATGKAIQDTSGAQLKAVADLQAAETKSFADLNSWLGGRFGDVNNQIGSAAQGIHADVSDFKGKLLAYLDTAFGGVTKALGDQAKQIADSVAAVLKLQSATDQYGAGTYYAVGAGSVWACYKGQGNYDTGCLHSKGDVGVSGHPTSVQMIQSQAGKFSQCLTGDSYDFSCVGRIIMGAPGQQA